jgi:hypothetical protein
MFTFNVGQAATEYSRMMGEEAAATLSGRISGETMTAPKGQGLKA